MNSSKKTLFVLINILIINYYSKSCYDSELKISIQKMDWGNACEEDISAVLYSSGFEIWKYFPNSKLDEILVKRRRDYPQMEWDRDSNNKIVIGLMTGDRYWSQYAYQFAHEFCHAIANHSNGKKPLGRSLKKPYLWFEESICETASLFALREMSRTWEKAPPYPNWNTYAPSLKNYAQAIINDPENVLPVGQNFQAWFISKQSKLKEEWMLRKNERIIAKQLLPLFEKSPYAWEAVAFLPNNNMCNDMTFAEFLTTWKKSCPPNLHFAVDEIACVFGIALEKKI